MAFIPSAFEPILANYSTMCEANQASRVHRFLFEDQLFVCVFSTATCCTDFLWTAIICKALPEPPQLLTVLPNDHAWRVIVSQSFGLVSTLMIASTHKDLSLPLEVLALTKQKHCFTTSTLTRVSTYRN